MQPKNTPEINFYAVDDDIAKAIAPLLIKILDEQKRALIFITNHDLIKKIDDSLWTYGRSKFIPHATIFDNDFVHSEQPILITNGEDNLNNANYLIFLDEPSVDFVNKFSRTFHFFDNSSNCKFIQPHNFYRKVEGKWQKVAKH